MSLQRAVLGSCILWLVGCSASLDPGTVNCRNDGECPTGAYCNPSGRCAADPSVLAAPVASAALDAAHDGISLTWPAIAGATSYQIYRATSAGAETSYATVAGGTAASVTWADPAPDRGLTDFYQVAASNGALASGRSNEVSAQTVPPVPSTVTAAAGPTGVVIGWSASAGATGYSVFRDSTKIDDAGASTLSYTDAAAAPGGTYTYTVAAINASGAARLRRQGPRPPRRPRRCSRSRR